jgi:LemA protein
MIGPATPPQRLKTASPHFGRRSPLSANWIIAIVVLVVLIIVALFVVGIYNKLVTLRGRWKNAFAQIDVQLQRRHDLIPNLVETAKGYMAHERETLEAVIQARNQAMAGLKAAEAAPGDPNAMNQLAAGEGALDGALGRLFAVMESYPDLKANQNMMQLSEELTSTENKVAFARQAYNDAVTTYNIYIATFPPVIFAGMLGFKNAQLLEVESEEARKAPEVSF